MNPVCSEFASITPRLRNHGEMIRVEVGLETVVGDVSPIAEREFVETGTNSVETVFVVDEELADDVVTIELRGEESPDYLRVRALGDEPIRVQERNRLTRELREKLSEFVRGTILLRVLRVIRIKQRVSGGVNPRDSALEESTRTGSG